MILDRKTKLLFGLGAVAVTLIARLFVIQIIDDKYKIDSSNNSMVYSTIYPTRGIIHDRNGNILVGNKVVYDLLVTPKEVKAFDTLEFCTALAIEPEFVREKLAEYRRYRSRIGWQTLTFLKQLPPERYMKFAEISYKFPGFRGQARSVREYPYNAGGNLLGYVSEVDADFIKKHPDEYRSGDYAGKTGIEAAMEKELRGEKKIEFLHSFCRILDVEVSGVAYGDGALDDHHCIGIHLQYKVNHILDMMSIEEVLDRVIVCRGCNDDEICILVCLTTIQSCFKVQFLFSKEFLDVFILNR